MSSSGGASGGDSGPPYGGRGFSVGKAISHKTFTSKISTIKLLMDAGSVLRLRQASEGVFVTFSITIFTSREPHRCDLVRGMMLGFEQVGKSQNAAALLVRYQHYIDVLVRTISNSLDLAVDEWFQLNYSGPRPALDSAEQQQTRSLDPRTITEQTPVYSLHARVVEQHFDCYHSKVEHFFDQAHHICQIQNGNETARRARSSGSRFKLLLFVN
jgi:hypothetical protein